ncbi:MAG: SufD family Fe-S cluster assembly protein [Thermoplasmata archaeon]|nr:SufD family Fe-S cluster assembly protein [Thermoplasmata archaeon]
MSIEDKIINFSKSRKEPDWLTELRLKNFRKYFEFKKSSISDSPVEKRYTTFEIEEFLDNIPDELHSGKFYEEKEYFIVDFTKNEKLNIKAESLKYTVLMGIREALEKYPEIVRNSMEDPKDEWTALGNALWDTGIFVIVPENRRCEKLMKFKTIFPGDIMVKKDIFNIGNNSYLQFVEYSNSMEKFNGIEETTINIGANSNLKHLTMIDGGQSKMVSVKNSHLMLNAYDEWYYALKNVNKHIMLSNADLLGDYSNLEYKGAILANGNEHYDVNTNIYHNGKNSKSNANVRATLEGNSRVIMRGSIKVSKNANDSNAYFAGNSLLLSENAKSNALPFLEIEGDRSQARHSASVTNVDYDQLFYLQSRGVDEKKAKNLLVEGFLDPVVRQIVIYEGTRYLIYD